jgi:dynein heavy chain 2
VTCQIVMERAASFSERDVEFVRGVLREVVYGGRIDNVFDLEVLVAYLQKYLVLGVIQGERPLLHGTNIPKAPTGKDINSFLQKIPDVDNPELFGLPKSIDKTVQKINSGMVIAGLKLLGSISN